MTATQHPGERDAPGDGTAPEPADWAAWVEDQCSLIAATGRWRAPRDFDAAGHVGRYAPVPGDVPDRDVVSFASNDYLGLSQHPAGRAAAIAAVERWGTGSGAARLIVGARPVHRELEHELAAWRGCEAAVLFPTGFAANLGALTTFAPPGTRLLSDELNHASIIDGARLSRADVGVYRHHDLDHLASLLHGTRRAVIVTDSVFSMDGDVADLDALAELAARHGALLVIDEAHAVLGPTLDVSAHDGAAILRVGTLSKTLGALGGFVAGTRRATELLVNRARSYIFTTASTPADAAAALANLRVLRAPEGDALVARLRANVDRVAPGHPSPIVPIVVGDEDDAVEAAAAMLDRGFLVPAIRPPTVPLGSSRLRITLSAAHDDAQIDGLLAALGDLGLGA